MLKHMKDIRSPIAVAKQKQAQRTTEGTVNKPKPEGARVNAHPPLGKTAPGAYPDVVSPGGEQAPPRAAEMPTDAPTKGQPNSDEDWVITPSGVSYAVSIYPYMAEQDDELDVVVGDYFIILQRARGWWNVQRDPQGTGVMDADPSKQGWVPAGCMLETKVPVAVAVAEASGNPSAGRTPILPLSIISTSYPGIVLTDYRKKGDEELDLVKDELVRVFKRYNHWSYVSPPHKIR